MTEGNTKTMEKLEAQLAALQEKATANASGLSELKATGSKQEDLGKVRIDLGSVESKVNTLLSELERVRLKQEADQQKALEQSQEAIKAAEASGKPDLKAITGVGSLLLTLIFAAATLSAWHVTTVKENLITEIAEAKAAASSAGKKAEPAMAALVAYKAEVGAQITDLQQRVPSETEWSTAEAEIDKLQVKQIEKLERLTKAEGFIERALLLIEKEEEARKVAVGDVAKEMESHDMRILTVTKKATNTAGTLKGVITEVEGQLRGIAVGTNTMIAGLRQNQAMLWQDVKSTAMPENDYYGLDVLPAGALVILNDTNGD